MYSCRPAFWFCSVSLEYNFRYIHLTSQVSAFSLVKRVVKKNSHLGGMRWAWYEKTRFSNADGAARQSDLSVTTKSGERKKAGWFSGLCPGLTLPAEVYLLQVQKPSDHPRSCYLVSLRWGWSTDVFIKLLHSWSWRNNNLERYNNNNKTNYRFFSCSVNVELR